MIDNILDALKKTLSYVSELFDRLKQSRDFVEEGNFRVFCKDGTYTRKMTYDAAQSYVSMLGGQIIYVRYHDPKEEECHEWN